MRTLASILKSYDHQLGQYVVDLLKEQNLVNHPYKFEVPFDLLQRMPLGLKALLNGVSLGCHSEYLQSDNSTRVPSLDILGNDFYGMKYTIITMINCDDDYLIGLLVDSLTDFDDAVHDFYMKYRKSVKVIHSALSFDPELNNTSEYILDVTSDDEQCIEKCKELLALGDDSKNLITIYLNSGMLDSSTTK